MVPVRRAELASLYTFPLLPRGYVPASHASNVSLSIYHCSGQTVLLQVNGLMMMIIMAMMVMMMMISSCSSK